MAAIGRLAVAGYRSLRDLRVELGPLTVVTGANGSGKSSLYRALRLLAEIAQGGALASMAAEGGLPSLLWAGPEGFSGAVKRGELPVQGTLRSEPVSVRLGFSSEDYGYAIDLGLPSPPTRFGRDPEIKVECAWTGLTLGRANGFAERRRAAVKVRDAKGRWVSLPRSLAASDSMLTQCGNVADGFELLLLREQMRAWRFYDHFRTDPGAPARQRQVGTSTPVLSADGADLAAAVATIEEIGAGEALAATVADAFPGGSIGVRDADGLFELEMRQHGLLRPLRAAELSDGTLRYLLLVAALLTPRPPPLMVLNEPETSLHPDLLAPLARMIAGAAERSQVIVVSHAQALVLALLEAGAWSVTLGKELGETVVLDGAPPLWVWPSR